jgi:ComF family protein
MGVFQKLLDLVYPPRCMFCHSFLRRGEKDICHSCRESLPVLEKKDRNTSLKGISNCISLFRYEGNVRQAILRYKFHGLSFYSREFAALLTENLTEDELACDEITWVPLSRKRKRTRGYDQAQLIAERLAAAEKVPCRCLLVKKRDVSPQSGSGGRKERKANIRDAYRIKDGMNIRGKTVLLTDDIVTTGATLEECAAVLLAAGAAAVKAVTIARTDKKMTEDL